jgi:RNA polymerase sigma factor (sigma-70 family)
VGSIPVATKDFRSFEEFYADRWASMVRVAWLLSGSREVAEDVVHDVFLRLEPRWEQLEDPAPYLRRSVINAVSAHHRRVDVERRLAPSVSAQSLDPETEEVWAIVAQLPERQRQALVLRFYLDLTVDEVAEHLGCPAGTAKSLLHRGISQLRRKVRQ